MFRHPGGAPLATGAAASGVFYCNSYCKIYIDYFSHLDYTNVD